MNSEAAGKPGNARPLILLLTNLYNDHEDEDIYLSQVLGERFNVVISSPFDCEPVEDKADLILIRNTWPNFDRKKEMDAVKARFVRKGLATYNPLTGRGDFRGKDYLIELYNAGYPVIPSVDKAEDLSKLPETDTFFAKPKYKCDNTDTFTATREQLSSVWLDDYIFQPYVDFAAEISFYFIDGEFIYSFITPRKVGMHELTEYVPTEEDLKFARSFVEWDNLPYGLIRIDACRTKEGKLLLVELEDFEPFLYLLWVSDGTRNRMIGGLLKAIGARLEKGAGKKETTI
jgi:hypothetical protein